MKLLDTFLFIKKNIKENNFQMTRRELISSLYIKGSGIEIGALHGPLKVFGDVNVKYVDRMTISDLRKQYPELNNLDLVNVDIISDGEKLEEIIDNSQDFVIANHFLEHCQNPLLALQNMLRVTKINGIVYLAIPDKRYTFDVDRPVTPFEHIEKDYINGPEFSRTQHFEEWVEYVNKITDDKEKKDRVDMLMEMDYSIHFHVWMQNEILDLLIKAKKIFSFDIEMINKNEQEVIFILSKV